MASRYANRLKRLKDKVPAPEPTEEDKMVSLVWSRLREWLERKGENPPVEPPPEWEAKMRRQHRDTMAEWAERDSLSTPRLEREWRRYVAYHRLGKEDDVILPVPESIEGHPTGEAPIWYLKDPIIVPYDPKLERKMRLVPYWGDFEFWERQHGE